MKKILILLLIVLVSCTAPKKCCGQIQSFLKYSTLYVSADLTSPLSERPHYRIDRQTGELTDETVIHPYNYQLNIGIRKIARFDYENKAKTFYDGSENNISHSATIGNVDGFEYNATLSYVRDRSKKFTNQNYWLRYVHKYFLIKGDYQDKQEIKLKHYGGEIRGRVSWGKFDFTAGLKHRSHPVYGVNPFEMNFAPDDAWFNIAYDLGYEDSYWYYDGEQNGVDDIYDYYNWKWYDPQGNLIADTDQEFYRYHFGRAIDEYNNRELEKMGIQQEVSAIIGIAFYHYAKNFWIHSWGDVMPYHKGLSEYAYTDLKLEDKTTIDFDSGLIIGTKLTTKLGLFIEGRYQRYWDIDNYELKTGINYLFL